MNKLVQVEHGMQEMFVMYSLSPTSNKRICLMMSTAGKWKSVIVVVMEIPSNARIAPVEETPSGEKNALKRDVGPKSGDYVSG